MYNISNMNGVKINSKASEYFIRNFDIKNNNKVTNKLPISEPYRKEISPFN